MKKIRAYILNSSKLIKRGEPGYEPGQEQAKEDLLFDGHVGQECSVEVKDAELRRSIFGLCAMEETLAAGPLCISVDVFETGKSHMTLYYLNPLGVAAHHNVSNYVSNRSEYECAQKVIDLLVSAQH